MASESRRATEKLPLVGVGVRSGAVRQASARRCVAASLHWLERSSKSAMPLRYFSGRENKANSVTVRSIRREFSDS
eukprot:scaffold2072_cov162-Amphora_coffeaeformis.AAC.17